MPDRLPILPNSIDNTKLVTNLKSDVSEYGIKEKIKIQKLFDDYIDNLEALVGENYLLSHQEMNFTSSECKLAITPYYMTNVTLHPSIWHILRFDKLELRGDRIYEYKIGRNHFFRANIAGRYRISANIQIYYVNAQSGSPTKYEGVVLYVAAHVVNFPDEAYLLAIYNTDGTQKEIISMYPFYTHHFNGSTNIYSNNFNLPFSGSTIMYLEKGEEIDLRVNLLGYNLFAEVRFRIKGTLSINLITEKKDLI